MESKELENKLTPPFDVLTSAEIEEAKKAYTAVAETIIEKSISFFDQLKEVVEKPRTPSRDHGIKNLVKLTDECNKDYQIMKRAVGRIGAHWHITDTDRREMVLASRMKYKYQIVPMPDAGDSDWE